MFRGGLFQFLLGVYSAAPQIATMFQTGKPAEFLAEMSLAGERSFAPGYRHELMQKWMPLLPSVQQRFDGWRQRARFRLWGSVATVTMAKAFPKSSFAGYDPYRP